MLHVRLAAFAVQTWTSPLTDDQQRLFPQARDIVDRDSQVADASIDRAQHITEGMWLPERVGLRTVFDLLPYRRIRIWRMNTLVPTPISKVLYAIVRFWKRVVHIQNSSLFQSGALAPR